MNAQIVLLVLLLITLVFGFGVVLWNRRGSISALSETDESQGLARRDSPMAVDRTVTDRVPDIAPSDIATPAVSGLRGRLGRTAAVISGTAAGLRQRGSITEATWDDLEEALLRADVGVTVTSSLLTVLRGRVTGKEIVDAESLITALRTEMSGRLLGSDRTLRHNASSSERVTVWLMVGVNGAGKTTSIGKLAAQQIKGGRRVMLAAGDTFRAAAAEQLEAWAERCGADIVRGQEGGDPSAVVFDAIAKAASRDFDLVIADTAGRLQNKANLMDELRKVRRVADREPGEVVEVLLVIDATTGQNGISQAREFTEAVGITGIVLTKLDGSAKGGVVFAIETEIGIPVKMVGIGEGIDDLVSFDPEDFVAALFAD